MLDDDYDPIVEHIISSRQDDEPLVTTAAFVAAQLEAARCWADADGTKSVAKLQDVPSTRDQPAWAAHLGR